MDSTELDKMQRRARLNYEWGRMRRAVLGFAPVLLIVATATVLAKRPTSTMLFGVVMFCVGVALLSYGRDLKRAVLPGVAAGTVPLTFALCANHFGHFCTGDGCRSMCIPACMIGGVIAGFVVAMVGHREKHGVGYLAAGSTIALLTGAMGCACVGYSGVLGLGVGYAVGFVPMVTRRLHP